MPPQRVWGSGTHADNSNFCFCFRACSCAAVLLCYCSCSISAGVAKKGRASQSACYSSVHHTRTFPPRWLHYTTTPLHHYTTTAQTIFLPCKTENTENIEYCNNTVCIVLHCFAFFIFCLITVLIVLIKY